MTPHQLIESARDLKGVPWRHRGRTRLGLDCIGMVICAMRQCGIEPLKQLGLRDVPYGRQASPELIQAIEAHLEPAPGRIPGALGLFRFYGEQWPRHVGLITENGNVIHCNAKHGGVMEHGLRAQWSRWLHSVWLLPGIDYGL